MIYIVEGIPGSGKDTYVAGLLSHLVPQARLVYAFDEAAILYSWKHYYVPNVDMLCLQTLEAIVQHVKATQQMEPEADFVFDRFHLSFLVRALLRTPKLGSALAAELQTRYRQLVDELRMLPVRITLATLEKHEIEARVRHPERSDAAWRAFLERRVAESRHSSLAEVWGEQQEMMLGLVERDGLPYERVRVRPPG